MGIYYNPPQPVQIPPPFAPIPAQGQSPPLGPTVFRQCYNVARRVWEPPDPQPAQRPPFVPIPKQGDQPPPLANYAKSLPWWEPTSQQIAQPKTAAWNVPPAVTANIPYTILPVSILASWQAPWQQPPLPVNIAPLTLLYGQQPPPQTNYLQALSQWQTAFQIPQTLQGTAAWNVPTILVGVPYARLPLSIRTTWESSFQMPQALSPTAAWNVRPPDAPPPCAFLPPSILAAWQPPWLIIPGLPPLAQGSTTAPPTPKNINLLGDPNTFTLLGEPNTGQVPGQPNTFTILGD